ncbi:MAG: conjugal transfer protein TrbD [Thiomonas sp. 20-64-5]|nr:MAG: conjugal transfer protein TrbD [Thiomonas sp. 20-64-5]
MMGGERNLVLMLAIIAGVFIFSLAHVWAAVMGITMWVIGQWALSRAAAYDPQLSQTGIRAMKYKRYYAAHATPFAPQREMK